MKADCSALFQERALPADPLQLILQHFHLNEAYISVVFGIDLVKV
jgi:hypothetical protein